MGTGDVNPQEKEIAMAKDDKKPKPIESHEGKQMDDNIDDLGRRPDGSRQDQPGATKPSKSTPAKPGGK